MTPEIINLISGFGGALLGSLITSIISYRIINKQLRIESNRKYVENLIESLQNVYISSQSRNVIDEKVITELNAFKMIKFKEFNKIENDIKALIEQVIQYNKHMKAILEQTSQANVSVEENNIKEKILSLIDSIVQTIYKIS